MLHNQDQRPAELGYILTDLFLKMNDIAMLSATQHVDLSFFVRTAQLECSAFTDDDDKFQTEWKDIQQRRNTLHKKKEFREYETGAEGWESVDLSFYFEELSAMVRSAYRMGVISKIQVNKTTWNPIEVEA